MPQVLYVNMKPEPDTDHMGAERITPAGSVWRVTEVTPDYTSIVCDATGGWINPTAAQLADPSQFMKAVS